MKCVREGSYEKVRGTRESVSVGGGVEEVIQYA